MEMKWLQKAINKVNVNVMAVRKVHKLEDRDDESVIYFILVM